jgi:ribosomal-protein-alanine N-acetyltransferase
MEDATAPHWTPERSRAGSADYPRGRTDMTISELFESVPTLQTERLLLRQLSTEDADDYFAIFSNDNVTRYYDVDTMTTVDQAKALIERHNAHYRNHVSVRYVLQTRDTDRIIGTFGFYDFKDTASVEIGFDLNYAYWKQGYMTEALRAAIAFIFYELAIKAIYGGFLEPNVASENLLKRFGFAKDKVVENVEIQEGVFSAVCFYKLDRDNCEPGR